MLKIKNPGKRKKLLYQTQSRTFCRLTWIIEFGGHNSLLAKMYI